MTFFDLRSSDRFERASIPEHRRHIRRPHPDDDDLRSLGSYTRTNRRIPRKDNIVEELKLQHEFEINSLMYLNRTNNISAGIKRWMRRL